LVSFAGDDPAAKTSFGNAMGRFGFAAVDVGRLREAGSLVQVSGGALAGLHALNQ
jgi:predicted dinucleotide-binding enzyme